MSFRKGGSGWTSFRKEELQEEEIWGILESNDSSLPSTALMRRTSTVAKMIPRSNRSSEQPPKMMTHQHASAPLSIPDWSKIYGGGGATSNLPPASRGGGFVRSSWESDDEEEDDENGMMPPHEWLARKYGRSEMSSFSVCEGVGRTLKGRDISRVRNAVLTRTGFLE